MGELQSTGLIGLMPVPAAGAQGWERSEVFRETPEEQHKEISATSSDKIVSLGTQLVCLYTNHMTWGKKTLEILVKSQGYDINGLSETWWDDSYAWSAGIDLIWALQELGKELRWVALCVRECFDCVELSNGDERIECFRVKASKADIIVRACRRPSSQDGKEDAMFCKQIEVL